MELSDYFYKKVVVITGASSGIGADLARQLSLLKTRLVLASRSEDKLSSLMAQLKDSGSEILICPTDVTDKGQVTELIRKTVERFREVDVLINNAGVGHFGPFESADVEGLRQVMETTYWGSVYASQSAIPLMKERGQGTIVNITSTAGYHGFPHIAVYSSAKAALHTLSEGLRMELSPHGIHVVEIQPGVIDNDFHINALGETRHLYRIKQIRGGDPRILTQRILKAIVDGKKEVVFPRYWWIYKILNRLFPSAVEWVVTRTQLSKLDNSG